MTDFAGSNLRRLMAQFGLTTQEVVGRTMLDRRTIMGILDGGNKPQPRTINRLAAGLGVSANEFFIDPAQLLYRHFDLQTNPAVGQIVEDHPELFAGWTAPDFDELNSRFGTGGPMTADGARRTVQSMNQKRALHKKLSLLLETGHAELIGSILELLYEKAVSMDSRGE